MRGFSWLLPGWRTWTLTLPLGSSHGGGLRPGHPPDPTTSSCSASASGSWPVRGHFPQQTPPSGRCPGSTHPNWEFRASLSLQSTPSPTAQCLSASRPELSLREPPLAPHSHPHAGRPLGVTRWSSDPGQASLENSGPPQAGRWQAEEDTWLGQAWSRVLAAGCPVAPGPQDSQRAGGGRAVGAPGTAARGGSPGRWGA